MRLHTSNTWKLFVGISLLWFFCVVVQGFATAHGINIAFVDFSTSGQFGDSFGSLSAIMATLAAIGAWQAVHEQKRDSAAREVEATVSRTFAERQAFEATFFSMLSFFGNLVLNTHVQPPSFGFPIDRNGNSRPKPVPRVAKDAFAYCADSLAQAYDEPSATAESAWISLYLSRNDELGHYFRVLYNIFLYIDEAPISGTWRYSRFVRAQLSDAELILLGYNCLYGHGASRFKPIVERYSLLDNLDVDKNSVEQDNLIQPLIDGFDKRAFSSEQAKIDEPRLFSI